MFIFLAIAMGPACWFMLYALGQFWSEAMRLRRRPEARLPLSVTPVTSTPAGQWDHPAQRASSGVNGGVGERGVVVITQPLSRRSFERDVA